MIGTFLRWFLAPFVLVAAVGLIFGNPWLLAKIVAGLFACFVLAVGAFAIASGGSKE